MTADQVEVNNGDCSQGIGFPVPSVIATNTQMSTSGATSTDETKEDLKRRSVIRCGIREARPRASTIPLSRDAPDLL